MLESEAYESKPLQKLNAAKDGFKLHLHCNYRNSRKLCLKKKLVDAATTAVFGPPKLKYCGNNSAVFTISG